MFFFFLISRMTLISERLEWPNGIAIDNGRMFWTDAKLGTIESASLADPTTDRIIILKNLSHPYALVVLDNHIYWTDWKNNAVHRAEKDGSNHIYMVKNIRGPMDIKTVSNVSNIPIILPKYFICNLSVCKEVTYYFEVYCATSMYNM